MSETCVIEDTTPRESFRFVTKRLTRVGVEHAVAIQGRAFRQAYRRIDIATNGLVTAFTEKSDFMDRKFEYYLRFADEGTGARMAESLSGERLVPDIGICTANRDKKDLTRVHLDGIFVDPRYQQRGVGSALLRAVLKDFPDWQTVYTETTYGTDAEGFFESQGFRKVDKQQAWPLPLYEWAEILLYQTPMELTRDRFAPL